jgi:predicted dinucleotide-binding enzyme
VANILPPDKSASISLGEQIQKAFPEIKVVKMLNTLNCDLMVDPARLSGGAHTLFISGNDAEAKQRARALVESFGWRDIIDLGDIATAAASEAYLPLWLALWQRLGTARTGATGRAAPRWPASWGKRERGWYSSPPI